MSWNQLAAIIAEMTATERSLPAVAVRECPEDYDRQQRVLRMERYPRFHDSPTLILERE